MKIIDYLSGTCRVTFDAANAPAVHNLLFRARLEYRECDSGDGMAAVLIRARYGDYLRRFAAGAGVSLTVGRVEGFPRVLLRYAGRYGIIVGCILAISIMTLSSLFVWDIRVEGNERLTRGTVMADLSGYGISIGGFIPSLDLRQAANRYMMDCGEIGWVSLYRRGNVVYVKVLEKDDTEVRDTSPPASDEGANLVAAEDALILSYELIRGRPVKKIGQVVRRGDILATGVIEGRADTSFVYSAGAVIGQMTKTVSVTVPRTTRETVCDGTVEIGHFLNIFGKTVKISQNTGNLPDGYDTIECEEQVLLFGKIALPLFVRRTYGVMYREERVTLTETEAVRVALSRMRRELALVTTGGTLTAKTTEGHFTADGYTLECTVTFARDIAKQVPFSVGNGGITGTAGRELSAPRDI